MNRYPMLSAMMMIPVVWNIWNEWSEIKNIIIVAFSCRNMMIASEVMIIKGIVITIEIVIIVMMITVSIIWKLWNIKAKNYRQEAREWGGRDRGPEKKGRRGKNDQRKKAVICDKFFFSSISNLITITLFKMK